MQTHPGKKGVFNHFVNQILDERGTQLYNKLINSGVIEWEMFDPKEGSDRRTAIVERFNRTLKDMLTRVDFQYNENRGTQWNHIMLTGLHAYNFEKNHRGLHEMVEHITEDKVEGPVRPKDVDPPLEDEIRVLKRNQNNQVWDWYQKHRRLHFKKGDQVTTKKLKEGELFPNRAHKQMYHGTIGERVGNTFNVTDTNTGVELKRKYLPWELKLVKRLKSVK